AETTEASLASTRHAVSRHFVGLHFGNKECSVTLTGNRVAYQFLGATVTVIPRRVDQRHTERNACAQRFFLSRFRMPSLAQTSRTLTDRRDNGAVPQLHSACWSVGSKN